MKEMLEFNVYRVGLYNFTEWEDDYKIYDDEERHPTKDSVLYMSSIYQAITYYIDLTMLVEEGKAAIFDLVEIGVENLPENNFVLSEADYNEKYGKAVKYSDVTIEDYYMHDGKLYTGDGELLETFVNTRSKYFNMKQVCNRAGVSYNTYRGFKLDYKHISHDKLFAIIKAMGEIGKESYNEDLGKQLSYIEDLQKTHRTKVK